MKVGEALSKISLAPILFTNFFFPHLLQKMHFVLFRLIINLSK